MTRGFPQSVCFRVTRACNARCGFCLAPGDGEHPREASDTLLAIIPAPGPVPARSRRLHGTA